MEMILEGFPFGKEEKILEKFLTLL